MSVRAFVIFVGAWAVCLWLTVTTSVGTFFGYLWMVTIWAGLAVLRANLGIGEGAWWLGVPAVLWIAVPLGLVGLGIFHVARNRDWWLARASWAGAVVVFAFPLMVGQAMLAAQTHLNGL